MPRIIVTQSDIKEGTPRDPGDCAIARAARRAFPRAQWVTVDNALSWEDKNGESHSVELTKREKDFINKFDDTENERRLKDLESFSFDVVADNYGDYSIISA